MAAALGSGSTTRPPLPQPWARALPLTLGSGPNPFEATRQPSNGRPETEDLRRNPLTALAIGVSYGLATLFVKNNLVRVRVKLRVSVSVSVRVS